MKRKNKVYVAACLVLICILAALIYARKEFNRKPVELISVNADFETDYETILNEFAQNEPIALAKYVGKVIRLTGRFNDWEAVRDGKPCFVVIGDANAKAVIRCSMDSAYCNTQISAGSFLQVKGVCIGFNRNDLLGSDLVLNRCVIMN